MPRHIMLAFTECDEGCDRAYAGWYENHLAELVDRTDCVAAQRFEFIEHDGMSVGDAPSNVAVYEFEGDLRAAMESVAGARPMLTPKPPEIDGRTRTLGVKLYSATTARVTT